jgi:hypothetical protein
MTILKSKIAWLVASGLLWGGLATDVWAASAPARPTETRTSETPAGPPSVLYGNIHSTNGKTLLSGVPIVLENTSTGLLIKKVSDS